MPEQRCPPGGRSQLSRRPAAHLRVDRLPSSVDTDSMSSTPPPRRSTLALFWAAFVVVWMFAALFALMLTEGLGPCGGDGGEPFAAPNSPAGRYCHILDSHIDSGEPDELTTAIIYLLPALVLIGIGAFSVWRRSRRLLLIFAVAASAVLVAHLVLALSLPDRCKPDDETRPGCSHYE